MKNLFALVVVASALTGSAANAAILTSYPYAVSPVHSFYLIGESTIFNRIRISIKPDGNFSFLNVNNGNPAAPRPAGESFTYRNRLLDANPDDVTGGKGWTLSDVVNTSQEIAFSGGPASGFINTNSEQGGQ